MKVAIAQTRPIKGDISANIGKHLKLIELAYSFKAHAIFFPELSLTGYEPSCAKDLAMDQDDARLDCFQQSSDAHKMTIGLGVPTPAPLGISISMIIFHPKSPRQTYSKQQLHADELPYFVPGNQQVILTISGQKIAPAICYESMLPVHVQKARKLGAEIYLASVAKTKNGVNKAAAYYPEVAKQFSIPVLMSNCLGHCDDFESAGLSAVWNKQGQLIGQLDDQREGIIIFDTKTEKVKLLP